MRNRFLISFFAVLVVFTACSSFFLIDEADGYLLSSTDKNVYYDFTIKDSTYYFKIDSIHDSFAEGSFFVNTEQTYTRLEKFEIKKKKANKYDLSFRDFNSSIKIKLESEGEKIYVRYALKKRFLYVFNLYSSWSDRVLVNKHIRSVFLGATNRFKEKVFDDFKLIKDVSYGKAYSYWDSFVPPEQTSYAQIIMKGLMSSVRKKNLDLKMDVYLPLGDTIKKRPLIMFIHGGGFYIGDKASNVMTESCKYFAQLGYVSVSINYRMGFQPLGSSVERAGYKALQDAHAAMRYLVKNADDYGIDTSLLFVGGSSAGAITSLNLAFMNEKSRVESTKSSFLFEDLGGIKESTNNIIADFSLKSVINMWGAINDIELLKNAKVPIISFHGNADDVVPIDYDYPFKDIKFGISSLFLQKMYGSAQIHRMAEILGLDNELHVFENHGHSLNVDKNENINDNFFFISSKTRDFLYKRIFPSDYQIKFIAERGQRAANVFYTDCKDFMNIAWDIQGGMVLNTDNNQARVIWFDNAKERKLSLSIQLKNGLIYNDSYKF